MTRKRYRYNPELGEMVELTGDHERELKKSALNHLGSLWGDRHYDGLQATDGADISTRKRHREYMRRTGYTTADDFTNTWVEAEKQRDHYRQYGGSVRKQDIRDVISQLQNKR